MMENPDENSTNLCRACGKNSSKGVSLFSLAADLSCTTFAEAFTVCTGLLIQPNYDPTTFMCDDCVPELKSSYKFYEKCKQTDDTFKAEYDKKPVSLQDPFDNESHYIGSLPVETQLEDGGDAIFLPVTDIPAEKGFECAKCCKEFQTKSALDKHRKRQVCIKPLNVTNDDWNCKVCGKVLKNRDSLRIHLMLHDDKQYTCSVCGKSFPQMRYLKTHKLVHEAKRKHKCKNCKAAYTLNTTLRRHLRNREDCRLVHFSKQDEESESSDDEQQDNAANDQHMADYDSDDIGISKVEIKQEIKQEITEPFDAFNSNNTNSSWATGGDEKKDVKPVNEKLQRKPTTGRYPGVVDCPLKFQCDICKMSFSRMQHLRKHMSSHKQFEQFKCLSCNAVYSQPKGLVRHLRLNMDCRVVHYAGGKNLPKRNRDLIMQDIDKLLQNPDQIVKRELKFDCDQCDRKFESMGLLKSHYYSHIDVKKYQCATCSSSFARSTSLRTHYKVKPECCPPDYDKPAVMREMRGKAAIVKERVDYEIIKSDNTEDGKKIQYSCKTCNMVMTNLYTLRNHCLNHKGIKAYQCTFEGCERGFVTAGAFRAHMNRHLDVKPYQCKHCGRTFYASYNMRRHENNCKEPKKEVEKTHLCLECGKMYSTVLALRAHQILHDEPKHVCDLCGRRFYRKVQLNTHRSIHLGIKQFKCDICKESFLHKKTLKSHLITHSDTPYRCHFCNTGFREKEDMKIHRKEEHKDILSKPAKKFHFCTMCDRSFTRTYFLEKHMASHADAPVFECHLCEKTFKLERSLQFHVKKHDERFKCTELTCGKIYRSENSYKKHMFNKHNIDLFKGKPVQNEDDSNSSHEFPASDIQNLSRNSNNQAPTAVPHPFVVYKHEPLDTDLSNRRNY